MGSLAGEVNQWSTLFGGGAAAAQRRAQAAANLGDVQKNASKSNFTPTAEAAQQPKTGAALADTFATPLPQIPQGQRLADVMGKVDSLSTTDLTPTPVQSDQNLAGQSTVFDVSTDQPSVDSGGDSGGGGGDWQQYADATKDAIGLVNAFRPPPRGPSPLPQPGPAIYTPTANAAQQRLQDLMRLRRGF